jgi:hypothetical protein
MKRNTLSHTRLVCNQRDGLASQVDGIYVDVIPLVGAAIACPSSIAGLPAGCFGFLIKTGG